MKKKTQKRTQPAKARRRKEEITSTNRSQIGRDISFYLDLMNDPRFKDENFKQIKEQASRSFSLHAASDEITIHFAIDWKGGSHE